MVIKPLEKPTGKMAIFHGDESDEAHLASPIRSTSAETTILNFVEIHGGLGSWEVHRFFIGLLMFVVTLW